MKVNDYELVPCLIRVIIPEQDEQEVWMDLEQYGTQYEYVPVIDHPHNDVENGQREVHYHRDSRYYSHPDSLRYTRTDDFRPQPENYEGIVHLRLQVAIVEQLNATNVGAISKSKLKHKCIHKGKCPHRGYDLSNEEAVDGVITCPLHTLKFNAKTKQLINGGN